MVLGAGMDNGVMTGGVNARVHVTVVDVAVVLRDDEPDEPAGRSAAIACSASDIDAGGTSTSTQKMLVMRTT